MKTKLVAAYNWAKAGLSEHIAARWGLLLLPAMAFGVWFAIGAVLAQAPQAKPEVLTSLINAGVFSIRVFAAIFFVHIVSHKKSWGWDLDNDYRQELQASMTNPSTGLQWLGAFAVLAGECIAKLIMLWLVLRALILWPQGIA